VPDNHEGEAFVMVLLPLYEETQQSVALSLPSTMQAGKSGLQQQRCGLLSDTSSASTLILVIADSRSERNKLMLLRSPSLL